MTYTNDLAGWAHASLVRAAKTFCQTAATLIGTGAVGFTDLDWVHIASVSGVAAVLSLLTSVAGIPEAGGGASLAKHLGR